MLKYLARKRVFRGRTSEPTGWPLPSKVRFTFEPLCAFGMTDKGGRAVTSVEDLDYDWDYFTGKYSVVTKHQTSAR